MYANAKKKTIWRSIGKREADGDYLFFFGLQNDFLRVALSSYEANVTFLFHFSDAMKPMRVHASLDLLSELIYTRSSEREHAQTMDHLNLHTTS